MERNTERKHPDVLSESHRAEKYYELFDENKRLKIFQESLNKDIEVLKNRLTYVKEKMVKRAKMTGDTTGKEFELIDENTLLREENKKLRTILKSKVPRENETTRPSAYDRTGELEQLVNKLKERLKENVQVIQDLRTENELI